jgi:hypothetical protein
MYLNVLDHNFQIFHILCLMRTRRQDALANVSKLINSSKYSYISIHDDYGLMMMYDIHMHYFFNITTTNGS